MQNSKLELKRRAYLFAITIIKFVEILPRDRATQIIIDQLIRSVTSIGANIIEAQASSSRRDFLKFFEYALKSANETKFWLGLLRDTQKANANKTNKLLKETNEIANMLGASVLTLKNKK